MAIHFLSRLQRREEKMQWMDELLYAIKSKMTLKCSLYSVRVSLALELYTIVTVITMKLLYYILNIRTVIYIMLALFKKWQLWSVSPCHECIIRLDWCICFVYSKHAGILCLLVTISNKYSAGVWQLTQSMNRLGKIFLFFFTLQFNTISSSGKWSLIDFSC